MDVNGIRCCIITKQQDSSFVSCNKLAFKPLTKDLVGVIIKKNLPLYFDNSKKSQFILCLSHRRMIQNIGKFNDSYNKLNVHNYELSEARELQEFMDDFLTYCKKRLEEDGLRRLALTSSTKDSLSKSEAKALEERLENLYERYRSYDHIYNAKSPTKRLSSDNEDEVGELKKANDDSKIPFSLLSAMALRRYKKFFKLPNRSGASSRAQLLDGIHDHVESIPLDPAETAAVFLYTLRNHKNPLDHHNSSGIEGADNSTIGAAFTSRQI